MRPRTPHWARTGTAFLAAFFLAAADPAPAALKDAISAYRGGDYAAAFKSFLALAKEGDHVAQYNLGTMYLAGRGTEKNLEEAVEWHRRAAEGGLAIAQYGLGVMYYRGDGVPKDLAEAAKWFRRAALQGYADAQFNLGVMYFNGRAVPRDMSEVVKWISLAAGKDHTEAMYRLGMMYEQGEPFDRNLVEALHWYRKAAANGHEQALARAGELGQKVDPEDQEGIAAANPLAPVPIPGVKDETPEGVAVPGLPVVESTAVEQHDQSVADATERPAPAEGGPAVGRGWFVQLGSFRTVEEAEAAWRRLDSNHDAVLAGLEPAFRRVELDGMGVFHRLQAGPLADGAAAKALCAALRKGSADRPCLPVPPDGG